jgi:hypothetical protein
MTQTLPDFLEIVRDTIDDTTWLDFVREGKTVITIQEEKVEKITPCDEYMILIELCGGESIGITRHNVII